MIEYRNHPDNNIVEFTVEGKITEQDMDSVAAKLKRDIDKHGELKILEEIRDFDGIDPSALWKDMRFGLSHLKDFSHAAIVADQQWIRTLSTPLGKLIPADVKAFGLSEIEQARQWLKSATKH